MSGKPQTEPGLPKDFTLPDVSGNAISLSDYHGKPVLLHFWASWCKPCVKELPEIEAAYREHKDKGFVVLAINVGEDQKTVQNFSTRLGLDFPIMLDEKWDIAAQYNVIGLPVSYFIDRTGVIHDKVTGGTLTRDRIATILKARDI